MTSETRRPRRDALFVECRVYRLDEGAGYALHEIARLGGLRHHKFEGDVETSCDFLSLRMPKGTVRVSCVVDDSHCFVITRAELARSLVVARTRLGPGVPKESMRLGPRAVVCVD